MPPPSKSMIANQRFGVGFWTQQDAVVFAMDEERRTRRKHHVVEHPIHGTSRIIFDVAPETREEAA